jgi:hypothetical protein
MRGAISVRLPDPPLTGVTSPSRISGSSQTTGQVFSQITDQDRTMQVPIGNITAENLQMIEDAPSIDTLAAAAGSSAYKRINFGSIDELTHYRVAFAARYPREAGVVVEPVGGIKRGRWFIVVLYDVTLQAENVQGAIGRGDLMNMTITFKGYPADGLTEGKEWGDHWLEQAGTIVAGP